MVSAFHRAHEPHQRLEEVVARFSTPIRTAPLHAALLLAVSIICAPASAQQGLSDLNARSTGIFVNADPESSSLHVYDEGTRAVGWGVAPHGTTPTPNGVSFLGGEGTFTAEQLGTPIVVGGISYFNGATLEGTNVKTIDLQITIEDLDGLSTPSSLTITRTLHVRTTDNTGDPVADADGIIMANDFPSESIEREGQTFALSLLGFGDEISDGFSDYSRLFAPEGGQADTVVWAVATRCTVPPGGIVETSQVFDIPRCGAFGARGTLDPSWGKFGHQPGGVLEADSGEKLEIRCEGPALDLPSYEYFYTDADGNSMRVGACPFEGGCNRVLFMHPGDEDGNGKPDCFLKTQWKSYDYGYFNDGVLFDNPFTGLRDDHPDTVDVARWDFDVTTRRLDKNNDVTPLLPGESYPFLSCSDEPRSGATPIETIPIDSTKGPVVGPDSEALFDSIRSRLQAYSASTVDMEEDATFGCDITRDGICDTADELQFNQELGRCYSDTQFPPFSDANGTGCITEADRTPLFGLPPGLPGDVDDDGDRDRDDVTTVIAAHGTSAEAGDDRDLDGDGTLSVMDARRVALQCTRYGCQPSGDLK